MSLLEFVAVIVFALLLVDALIANLIAWRGQDWYKRELPSVSKHLPLTKAWAAVYLLLVTWISVLTFLI